MHDLILAGAVVNHERLGRGTVLEVDGAFADIYFPDQEGTPDGPWWTVDLGGRHLSLVEASADPPQFVPSSYGAYVVELRDAANLGPLADPRKPYLYVGISENTPARRFRSHKEGGIAAANIVLTYGLYLRPSLYRSYERVATEEAATTLELRVAEDLRKEGYVVHAGAPGFPWPNL